MRCAQCGLENALTASTCTRCHAVLGAAPPPGPTVPSDEIRRGQVPARRPPPPIRHRPPRDTEVGQAPGVAPDPTIQDLGPPPRAEAPWVTSDPLSLAELAEIDRSLAIDSATEQIPMADLLAKVQSESSRTLHPWEEVIAQAPPQVLKKWGTTPEAEAETRIGNKAPERSTSVATEFGIARPPPLPQQRSRPAEPALVSSRPAPSAIPAPTVPPRIPPALARATVGQEPPRPKAPEPPRLSRPPEPTRPSDSNNEDTDLAFPKVSRSELEGPPIERTTLDRPLAERTTTTTDRPPSDRPTTTAERPPIQWGTTGTTGATGASSFRLPSVSTSLDERVPGVRSASGESQAPVRSSTLPAAPVRGLPPRTRVVARTETEPTHTPPGRDGSSTIGAAPRAPAPSAPSLEEPRQRSLSSLAQETTRPPLAVPGSATPNPHAIPIPPAETKPPQNPPPRPAPERFATLPTFGEIPRPGPPPPATSLELGNMPSFPRVPAIKSNPPAAAPLRSSPPSPLPPLRPSASLPPAPRQIPPAETTRPPQPSLARSAVSRPDSISADPSRPGFATGSHSLTNSARTKPEALKPEAGGTPQLPWEAAIPAKRDVRPLVPGNETSMLPWELPVAGDTALKNPPVVIPKQLTADLVMPSPPSPAPAQPTPKLSFVDSTPNSGTMVGRLGPAEHDSGEHGAEMTRVALEGELAGPAPVVRTPSPPAPSLSRVPAAETRPPQSIPPTSARPAPARLTAPPIPAPPPYSSTPRQPAASVGAPRPQAPSSLPPSALSAPSRSSLPRGLSETEPAEPQSMPGMPVHALTGDLLNSVPDEPLPPKEAPSVPGFSPAPNFDSPSDPAWNIRATPKNEDPPPQEETRAMPRSELDEIPVSTSTLDRTSSAPNLEPGVDHTAELAFAQGAPTTFTLGKTMRRTSATVIDALLVLGIVELLAIGGILGEAWQTPLPLDISRLAEALGNRDLAPVVAAVAALSLALSTLSTGLIGASPGKLLLGLRVIVRKTGQRPGFFRSLIRACFSLFSAVLGGAGYFWPLLDRQYRVLHDVLSGTAVVRRPGRAGAAASD